MSNINYNLVKEIQEKADIVGVISNYIKLSPKGNNYVGLCPFHADTDPSLTVSPQKKIWKCFSCNENGNVFTFVEKFKNISFIQSVKEVAELSGFEANEINKISSSLIIDLKIQRLYDLNTLVSGWYQGFLNNKESLYAREYLQQRKISDDIIKKFEIGLAPSDGNIIYQMVTNENDLFGHDRDKSLIWTQGELIDAGLINVSDSGKISDFFVNRITFPIKDGDGQIVGFAGRTLKNSDSVKYLNTGTTKIFNKASLLFNFFNAKTLKPSRIYVVEGYMDAISLHRVGYENVVALMGTTLSNKHIELLRTITSLKTVVLCLDNDAAGLKATFDNAYKLLSARINTYVINLSGQSYKDIDEIVSKNESDKVKNILENIQDFISFKIEIIFAENNDLKIDEVQSKVHEILNDMVLRGDNLLKTKNLKLLSEKTNLAFNDLEAEYDKLVQANEQKSLMSSQRQNFNKPSTRKNYNSNVSKFEEMEPSDLSEILKQKKIDFLTLENIQRSVKASTTILKNSFNELIWMMLLNNKYIDDYLTNINIHAMDDLENQIIIIKMIKYLYVVKNVNVTLDSLLEALNSKLDVKKYKEAIEFMMKLADHVDNQEIFKMINSKYKSEKFKQVWQRIKDHQYGYMLYSKIIRLYEYDRVLEIAAFDACVKDILYFRDLYIKSLKKSQ